MIALKNMRLVSQAATLFACASIAQGFSTSHLKTTPTHHVHKSIHQLARHQQPLVRCKSILLSNSASLDKTSVNKPKKLPKKVTATALTIFALTTNAALSHAKKAATSTATATPSVILPPIPTLIAACILPTLLGYYKSEYGVSYGYGTAMAASSYLVLSSLATGAGLKLFPSTVTPATILPALKGFGSTLKSLSNTLAGMHALALFFYGTRLDLFLIYRETCLPRFRVMRERIEDRAKKQGSRLKRTPFILSCAFLYFCMVVPVLVTSQLCGEIGMGGVMFDGLQIGIVPWLEQILRVLVGLTISGFLLGAIGDMNKSFSKLLRGEDALITGGVFRFFRHPNYTGEVIGWVSSCLAAFTAVAWKAANGDGVGVLKNMLPFLGMSVLGAIGITFVLGTATAGLEFRQKEKYGDTKEYQEWVKRSWVGFTLGQRKQSDGDDGGVEAKEKKE